MVLDLLGGAVQEQAEVWVGVARVGVGWGVTALEPALAGNVFALIAVPGCLIK